MMFKYQLFVRNILIVVLGLGIFILLLYTTRLAMIPLSDLVSGIGNNIQELTNPGSQGGWGHLAIVAIGWPSMMLSSLVLGPLAVSHSSNDATVTHAKANNGSTSRVGNTHGILRTLNYLHLWLAVLFGIAPVLLVAGVYFDTAIFPYTFAGPTVKPVISHFAAARSSIAWLAFIVNTWGINCLSVTLGHSLGAVFRSKNRNWAAVITFITTLILISLSSFVGFFHVHRATDPFLLLQPTRTAVLDIPLVPIILYALSPYVLVALTVVLAPMFRHRTSPASAANSSAQQSS